MLPAVFKELPFAKCRAMMRNTLPGCGPAPAGPTPRPLDDLAWPPCTRC